MNTIVIDGRNQSEIGDTFLWLRKANAKCDRDEGPIEVRLNDAGKAYMEWMPIRKGPFGEMGFVETDITQVSLRVERTS